MGNEGNRFLRKVYESEGAWDDIRDIYLISGGFFKVKVC